MKVDEKSVKVSANYFAICVVLLVGIAPFFRGLFFETEMEIHLLGTSVLMLCAVVLMFFSGKSLPDSSKRAVNQIWRSPYFIALGFLMLCYGLTFYAAINPRMALFTWLRQVDYLVVFIFAFIATLFMYEAKKRQVGNYLLWFLLAITIMGTAVSAIAIAAAQGFVTLNGAIMDSRLCSTLQYPNTLAAFLTVPFLTGIHITSSLRNRYVTAVSAGMTFLILLAVLGTQSRGAWMLIPLFIFFYWLGQKEKKTNLACLVLLFTVAIAVSSGTVGPEAQQGKQNGMALAITLAITAGVGAVWLVGLPHLINWEQAGIAVRDSSVGSEQKPKKRWNSNIVAIGGIAVLLLVIFGAYMLFSGSENPVLQRIASINTGDNNFRERLVFYSDAWRMGLERPLLGWGGGGWKAGYRAFQSFLYNTTEVHNHFLQVWVETGILGFLSFVSVFLMIPFGLYSLLKIDSGKNELHASSIWTIGISALALALHSAFDFNLSLSAVSLLLWALIGVYGACELIAGTGVSSVFNREINQTTSRANKTRRSGAVSFALLNGALFLLMLPLVIFPFLFRGAESEIGAYQSALNQKDFQGALNHLQQTMESDRWKSDYPIATAQLLVTNYERAADEKMKARMLEESERLARKSVELDAYNTGAHMLLAQVLIARGNYDEALAEAELGKSRSPWLVTAYMDAAKVNSDVAIRQRLALSQGQGQPNWKVQSEQALNRVLEIATEASSKKETLPAALKSLWRHPPDLTLTPELAFMAGKAALLLGDPVKAEQMLASATEQRDDVTKTLVELWRGAAMKKRGDNKGNEIIEAARVTSVMASNEYSVMKQLGL
ncbi:tetratricopeptide repeat protein [Heliobacterium gestii]|uniref:Tetratricopeptide repeat protein n=1 Tax=Heliomicrobium gestii TaxID=2699 RepID=A0A845LJT4_HELGE|nr:O-antigen ligase family protein [Heliomicrobium gestii]MBM7866594.1 O-antigen ligase [Heliomicrobium gestii]MZP43126.1 tetratricopeptide repeat protein [Heliomicrobium gestii]